MSSDEDDGRIPKRLKAIRGSSFCSPNDTRLTRKRLGRLLFSFYKEQTTWRKYGALKTCCKETHILAPVKLWWWMSELFLILTTALLVYKLFAYNRPVLVPACIVALVELMAFYKTCLRDPGILPRPDYITAFKNLLGVMNTYGTGNGIGVTRFYTHPNGQTEQQSFCWKCNHFRPMHTTHCGKCDCCMLKHDHHCPVFGGCVAQKNLASFHTMVATQIIFWVYVLGYCIYNVSTTEPFQILLAPDEETRDRLLTPKHIFFAVLLQIAAVIVIPLIVSCTIEIFCKRKRPSQTQVQFVSNENVEELLHFARINNFTVEEIENIKKIYRESLTSIPGTHNQILKGPSTSDENENDSAEIHQPSIMNLPT